MVGAEPLKVDTRHKKSPPKELWGDKFSELAPWELGLRRGKWEFKVGEPKSTGGEGTKNGKGREIDDKEAGKWVILPSRASFSSFIHISLVSLFSQSVWNAFGRVPLLALSY